MENFKEVPQKAKNETSIWLKNPILASHMQEKLNPLVKETFTFSYLLYHYSQNARNENNLTVHVPMSKQRRCDIPTKEYYLVLKWEQNFFISNNTDRIGVTELYEITQAQSITWSHSYV